jgi:hypothetical protein
MQRHTTRGRVARFLPRLEALEDRSLLSCTVSVNSGILTITGDSGPNKVTITDKGTGAPGNIMVVCDSVPTNVMPAIKGIKVLTLDGIDSVRYQLAGNLQAGVAQNVLVNLGSGNDNFVSFFSAPGGLLNNSSLGLNVKGGAGQDTLHVRYTTDVDIRSGATLSVNLDGGEDADSIFLGYQGELDGKLTLNADGGAANDMVQADLTLDCGSTGGDLSRVRGGLNADRLIHRITQSCPSDPVSIDGKVIHDMADFPVVHTSNVLVI